MRSEVDQVAAMDDRQQCIICLQFCVRPVRCKGPCQKMFCLKCVAELKRRRNRCPNRCSSPFEVAIIPELPPALTCPFNPERCHADIADLKSYQNHYESCRYVPAEVKEQLHYKNNFRCEKGHPLQFLYADAQEVIYGYSWLVYAGIEGEGCAGCGEKAFCRSICMTCTTKEKRAIYCPDCRNVPMSKSLCPMGHHLKRYPRPGRQRFCDFCCVPADLLGKAAYGCHKCNFDICESCMLKLEENDPLIPLPLMREATLHEISAVELCKRGGLGAQIQLRRPEERRPRLQLVQEGGEMVWRRRARIIEPNPEEQE